MAKRNKFIYTIISFVCISIFFGCDTYQSRKKLITELSSLYNENRSEFDKIQKYFSSDTIAKFFTFGNKDNKIELKINKNILILDSIVQIKDSIEVYQILTFMKKEKIRTIYGYGNGSADISFEGYRYPCFNFLYRSDFNPDDEYVKQEVENIKNTKTKNWIYILGDGWYIRGVKCF